jgi:hypothetical protein
MTPWQSFSPWWGWWGGWGVTGEVRGGGVGEGAFRGKQHVRVSQPCCMRNGSCLDACVMDRGYGYVLALEATHGAGSKPGPRSGMLHA